VRIDRGPSQLVSKASVHSTIFTFHLHSSTYYSYFIRQFFWIPRLRRHNFCSLIHWHCHDNARPAATGGFTVQLQSRMGGSDCACGYGGRVSQGGDHTKACRAERTMMEIVCLPNLKTTKQKAQQKTDFFKTYLYWVNFQNAHAMSLHQQGSNQRLLILEPSALWLRLPVISIHTLKRTRGGRQTKDCSQTWSFGFKFCLGKHF